MEIEPDDELEEKVLFYMQSTMILEQCHYNI